MLDGTARIVIRGAGDVASGIALQLWRSGLRRILLLETAQPLAVRRRVSFSEAVYAGVCRVEEVRCRLIQAAPDEAHVAAACETLWSLEEAAVLVDPDMACLAEVKPTVIVDATLAKQPTGLTPQLAPLVLAVGPGQAAGKHVHAVIETQRGPTLGAVIRSGEALPNTGIPASVQGITLDRVLRAPAEGIFRTELDIGAQVQIGECIGWVESASLPAPLPVPAAIGGVVRGLLRDGIPVQRDTKLGDIDPRRDASCVLVSDKALAVGAGVLEAIRALAPTTRP